MFWTLNSGMFSMKEVLQLRFEGTLMSKERFSDLFACIEMLFLYTKLRRVLQLPSHPAN